MTRFFTYAAIFWLLPPKEYFNSFTELNSVISCSDYLSYSTKFVLSPEMISIFYPILASALILSAFGFLFNVFSAISFILFSGFIIHTLGACYSNHQYYPLGLVLLLWMVGGNLSRYSLDYLIFRKPPPAAANYLFLFLKINFCLIFFYAGMSKLMTSGFDWFLSDNLKLMLTMQNYFHEGSSAQISYSSVNAFIVAQPSIANLLAGMTVVIEISTLLILPLRKFGWIVLVGLVLLQIGIKLTLYINFLPWLPLYFVWFFSFLDKYLRNYAIKRF